MPHSGCSALHGVNPNKKGNGFTSSQSTAYLLTVVSDGIARAFNRFGAI